MAAALILLATIQLSGDGASCARVVRPVAQGQVLVSADFAAAPCEAVDRTTAAPRPWRYDSAAHVLRARAPLTAGRIVDAPPSALLAVVRPGQALRVSVRAGAVIVEREVVALQSARAGQRVFVRDVRGGVFAAQLPAARP